MNSAIPKATVIKGKEKYITLITHQASGKSKQPSPTKRSATFLKNACIIFFPSFMRGERRN